jgi:hypothetical protein
LLIPSVPECFRDQPIDLDRIAACVKPLSNLKNLSLHGAYPASTASFFLSSVSHSLARAGVSLAHCTEPDKLVALVHACPSLDKLDLRGTLLSRDTRIRLGRELNAIGKSAVVLVDGASLAALYCRSDVSQRFLRP